MQRYLIEAPHTEEDCLALIEEVNARGYLSNFDWGCRAGIHTGWTIIEAESIAEARMAVPPLVRPRAHIIPLNKFDASELAVMHEEQTAARHTT
jgi:hypothetical protein